MNPFDGIPDAPDFSDVQGGATSFANPFDEVDPQEEARKRKRAELAAARKVLLAQGLAGPEPAQSVGDRLLALANRPVSALAEGLVSMPELAAKVLPQAPPSAMLSGEDEEGNRPWETTPYPTIGTPGGFFDLKAQREDIARQAEAHKEALRGSQGDPYTIAAVDTLAEAAAMAVPLGEGGRAAKAAEDAQGAVRFSLPRRAAPVAEAAADMTPAEAAYLARRAKVLPTIPGVEEPFVGPGAVADAMRPESKILQVGAHADDAAQDVALGLRARPEDAADAAELGRQSLEIHPETSPPGAAALPDKTVDLGGAGQAIADNLYSGMWDRLSTGKMPEPFPQQSAAARLVKEAFDRGEVTSPDDIRRIMNDYAGKNYGAEVPQIRPETAPDSPLPPVRPGTKALTNVAGMQGEFRDLVEKHADVIEATRGARVPATVWHDAQGLADDLGMTREDFLNSPGGRIFNAQEVSLAKHYMGGMKQEISDLSKKLAAGEIPEAERAAAVARLDSLNTDTVRMMAVVQKQFSEAGRTLRSGQELLDPFGGTPDLKAALVKRYSARAADEAAAAEAQALKKLTKDAAFEARKAARAAAKTDLSAEFADLSSQFGKLAGRPRMGLDPELVKLVGSLAKNRVKAGVNTLEEIVDQIYQAARPHFEDISPEDIKAAILQHTLGPKAPKPAGTPRPPSPDVALKGMVDPLSAGLTKRYGGLSDDVIQQIARLPDDPGDPALLNFLRSMERPTFKDYMGALSYHFMLSGPKSAVRNVVGNTVKRWTDLAMKPVEAAVEAPLARLQGRVPERFVQETLPAVVGNFRGAGKGLEKALYVLKNGYDPERLVGELTGTGASKWETGGRLPLDPFLLSQNRLVRGIGRVTGYGPNIMTAGDVMAKARAATSANYAWATRKAIQDVRAGLASSVEDRAAQLLMEQPDEMLKFSEEAARKATYQDQMSGFGQKISGLRHLPGPPGTMASYAMPFLHVSDRVGAFLLDFTPGARSFAIYKAAKEGSPVASDLIARQLAGSAFAAAATGWAFHGKLTGSMSRMDPKLRNDAYAAGKQPYSLLVGDHWVPVRDVFGGLAGPVVAAAAFHDQMTTGEPVDAAAIARAAGGSVIGEARYLLDASYLQSLSQAVSAIEAAPDQAGQEAVNLAARTGEGFYVPFSGLLRNVATARDPRVVDAQGPLDTFKSAVPGLRETLPATLDSMGHELVANTGAAGGFLPFVPTRSTIADPQLADDVSRLRYTVGLHATGLNKAEKRQEAAWQAVDVAKPEDRARLLAQAQKLVADNPKADWAKWVRKQTDDVHKLEEELRQVKANAVISPAAKRKIELELDQQMKLILQGTLNALNQPAGAAP